MPLCAFRCGQRAGGSQAGRTSSSGTAVSLVGGSCNIVRNEAEWSIMMIPIHESNGHDSRRAVVWESPGRHPTVPGPPDASAKGAADYAVMRIRRPRESARSRVVYRLFATMDS